MLRKVRFGSLWNIHCLAAALWKSSGQWTDLVDVRVAPVLSDAENPEQSELVRRASIELARPRGRATIAGS